MNRFLSLLLAVQAQALKKVLVTGAGGRTGKLVFEQLKADDNYKPVGLARSGGPAGPGLPMPTVSGHFLSSLRQPLHRLI